MASSPSPSPPLITPTSNPKPLPITALKPKLTTITTITATTTASALSRRHMTAVALTATILSPTLLSPATALASNDDEYVEETKRVIDKVRATISLDKADPSVADKVAELRETSNSWVAKYRKEKDLLGRLSFRDVYSALNAVSGHYISFGPTAPIPAKRRVRILEEMDTAEKALLRGK